jgi:hypothetical protein
MSYPVILHHDAPVRHAAFSRDGIRLIRHSDDGTVREWPADVAVAPVLLTGETQFGALAWLYGDGTRFTVGFKDPCT